MKSTILSIIVFMCALTAHAQRFDSNNPTEDFKQYAFDYRGWIDGKRAGLFLRPADSGSTRLIGHYFFFSDPEQPVHEQPVHEQPVHEQPVDIPINGEIVGPREIKLVRSDSYGNKPVEFTLRFAESDTLPTLKDSKLGREVMLGQYTVNDTSKPVRFTSSGIAYLLSYTGYRNYPTRSPNSRYRAAQAGGPSDQAIEATIRTLTSAILANDKHKVANLLMYPIRINRTTGKSIEIKNKQAFLQVYDVTFTKRFLTRLSEDVPHDLFENIDGIMIADGLIWFDGLGNAFAINPP